MVIKIPITRKLITVGASRGITLPKSWLNAYELQTGREITTIEMEIDGSIVIRPALARKKEKGK